MVHCPAGYGWAGGAHGCIKINNPSSNYSTPINSRPVMGPESSGTSGKAACPKGYVYAGPNYGCVTKELWEMAGRTIGGINAASKTTWCKHDWEGNITNAPCEKRKWFSQS